MLRYLARIHKTTTALTTLITLTVILFVFRAALSADFIFLDDGLIVTKNHHVREGLSLASLRWALTGVHAANWMPLTWASHQLDWSLYRDNPLGHHLTSVLLHVGAALLLVRALTMLSGRPLSSLCVGLLFGIHPLRAESVVWIAERKDVLCGWFFSATLLAWAYFRATQHRRYRLLVFVFVACGLASKSMMVTTPAVLVLVDLWLDGEVRWRRIIEMLPEICLAAGTAMIMVTIQDNTSVQEAVPFFDRVQNATVATWRYVELTIWPFGLSVFHPGLRDGYPLGTVVASACGLMGITVLAVSLYVRGNRAPLIGWLWFLGVLLPVSGLVPLGAHALAERYTYLPHIGLFSGVVFGLHTAASGRHLYRLGWLAVIVLLLLAARTQSVVDTWRSSWTLACAGLRTEPSNPILLVASGAHFLQRGEFGPAIERYEHAISAQRTFFATNTFETAHAKLGLAHVSAGNYDVAINLFLDVLTDMPNNAIAHRGLSVALARTGDITAAINEARLAIRDGPEDADNYRNLMSLLATTAQWDEATRLAARAPSAIRRDLSAFEVRLAFLRGGCNEAHAVVEEHLAQNASLPQSFFEERALATACRDALTGVHARAIPSNYRTRAGVLSEIIIALRTSSTANVVELIQRFRAASPQPGLSDLLVEAHDGQGLHADALVRAIDRATPSTHSPRPPSRAKVAPFHAPCSGVHCDDG